MLQIRGSDYEIYSRAVEATGLEIKIVIKRIDKEKTGFGQGTQIGKSSSRALEAPRLEIKTLIKRADFEKTGFGQGTQIGKSSSRALEA